jgi:hypothetical protein
MPRDRETVSRTIVQVRSYWGKLMLIFLGPIASSARYRRIGSSSVFFKFKKKSDLLPIRWITAEIVGIITC